MSGSVFTAATGFLRGVGNQAAVSVAASAIAAAFLALPAGVSLWQSGGAPDPAAAGASAAEGWALPIAADGKIRARHQDSTAIQPVLPARDGQGLISPAAIVMPMTLSWDQPTAAIAAAKPDRLLPAETKARTIQAQVSAPAQPPRRPAMDRIAVAADGAPLPIAPLPTAPLPITPAALAAETSFAPPPRLLGMAAASPFARVGDAMSGAVGLVGAAGIWTLSRASSLLPRL